MIAQFPGDQRTNYQVSNWITRLVLEMKKHKDIANICSWSKCDTPITMVRNDCLRSAIKLGVDYVLMIDNDTVPDWHCRGWGDGPPEEGARPFFEVAWEWLKSHRDQPGMIFAPYVGPPPHENCYQFQWVTEQSDCPPPNYFLRQFGRDEARVRTGVEEVGAAPTGCIVIDVRVPLAMDPPYFFYEYSDRWQTEKASTEDVVFSRNASMLGFKVWCAWDCWAAHYKSKYCGKPWNWSIDQVSQSLVSAVRRGYRSNERLLMIGRGSGRSARPSATRPVAPPIHGEKLKAAGVDVDRFHEMSVKEQLKALEEIGEQPDGVGDKHSPKPILAEKDNGKV